MLKYLNHKTWEENIDIALLSLVFISLPFSPAINSISLGVYLIFNFFFNRRKSFIKGFYEIFTCIALGAFFWITCLWLRDFESRQFDFLLRILPMAILPFIFSIKNNPYSILEITLIISVSSILAILFGIYTAVEFYTRPEEHFELIHLPHTLKGRYHSVYLSMQLGVNVILLFSCYKQYRKKYLAIIALLLIIVMILLGKRMGLVALFIVGALYACNSLRRIIVSILTVLILGIIFMLLPYNKWRVEKLSKIGEGSERIIMLNASLKLINDYCFFGVGTRNVSKELEKVYKEKNIDTPFYSNNPHNQFLYIAITHGLVGLVLYFVLQVWLLADCWKRKNKLYLYLYLFLTLVSMTEVILIRQQGIVLYSVTLSFLFFNKKHVL